MADFAVSTGRLAQSRIPRPRVPPIDTYPWALAFAKTPSGKALFAIVVAVVLLPYEPAPLALAVAAAAGACAFAGPYRPFVLPLAMLVVLAASRNWLDLITKAAAGAREGVFIDIIAAAAALLASFACYRCAVRLRNSAVFRRPILSLLVLYSMLVWVASSVPVAGFPRALFWSFIAAFGGYIWCLSYALIDASRGNATFYVRLGAFRALWNWTSQVPFGKGVAYLRKHEAKNADELAVTQLKGIKLLLWACILRAVLIVLRRTIYGLLAVPSFDAAFDAQLAGMPLPVAICWMSLIAAFLERLLGLACWGHTIIAIARISGYRLPRNTRRPLSSRTIAEFWNRYYFYFKELLVDLFFYPTFLRCFRSSPRLRLAFATFMAAGVGNLVFHFTREVQRVSEIGLGNAVIGFQTYAFYCLILATGITVSQLRRREPRLDIGFMRRRLWPSLGVGLFFCMLHIFDDVTGSTTLAVHLRFLFHLFGVDLLRS